MSGNSTHCKTAFVRCMDNRLTDSPEFNAWAMQEMGPKHDLLSFAGGPVRLSSSDHTLIDDLEIADEHHRVERFVLCIHSGCGYNSIHHAEHVATPEKELDWMHICFSRAINAIRRRLGARGRSIEIDCYFARIHDDGHVTIEHVPHSSLEPHIEASNIQPFIPERSVAPALAEESA